MFIRVRLCPGATKPQEAVAVVREFAAATRAGGEVTSVDPRAAPKHTAFFFLRPQAFGPLPDVPRHVETPIRADPVGVHPYRRCLARPSLRCVAPRRVELIAPRIFPLYASCRVPRGRTFPFLLRGQPESRSAPPAEKARFMPVYIQRRLVVRIGVFVAQLLVPRNHALELPVGDRIAVQVEA